LCYLVNIASPSVVNCDYKIDNFVILRDKYKCEVKKELEITSKNSSLITGVNGLHKRKKGNDDVTVFSVKKYTVNYFPTGLKKIFKNLEGIAISLCGLKEIHQNDLKPFPKLGYLDLNDNDIEVIEAGIFEFNKNLKLVWLKRNKIHHIDLNVFEGLTQLTNLNLVGNNCTNLKGINATEVEKVIHSLNSTCTNQEYLERKFKETGAAKLDKEIMIKNESLANIDQNSTSNHDSLLSSIESLITKKMEENFNKTQNLFTNLSEKVDKLEQDLTEAKKQLTESYKINTKTSKETLQTLEAIQKHQTELASNYLTNSSTKCDTLADKIPNDLTNALNFIRKSQENISQELQEIKKASQSSSLSQNLSLFINDVEQVKNTLSTTKIYLADTIETSAKQIKSDLETLKVNIQEVKGKTSDMETKVDTIKTNLESIRKESQNAENLPIITTATVIELTLKPVGEDTSTLSTQAEESSTSTTQAEESSTSTTQAAESSTSSTQDAESSTSTTQSEESSTSTTQSAESSTSTTQAEESSTSTTQAAESSTSTTQAEESSTLTTQAEESSTSTTQDEESSTSTTQAEESSTSTTQAEESSTSTTQAAESSTSTTQAAESSTLTTQAEESSTSTTQAEESSTLSTQNPITEDIVNIIES